MTSRHIVSSCLRQQNPLYCSYSTQTKNLTNSDVRKKRNDLFGRELARQKVLVSRLEKVEVEHKGPPEDCTLLMNKGISTPFNCAMHIHELLMNRTVLATVNGRAWDFHRPLEENCELRFHHFKEDDPKLVNQAYWRTGSFLLGYVLERAFKDQHYVELCSFPAPHVESGSFVYDLDLNMAEWKPTENELKCMSRIACRLSHENIKFERLDVDASVAEKMFEDNRFKSEQVPQIAARSETGTTVPVYRLDDHIDITTGPLIASTNLLGRFDIAAIHNLHSSTHGDLQRVQGISIPKQLPIHYWSYELLLERAKNLNSAPIPEKEDQIGTLSAESGR